MEAKAKKAEYQRRYRQTPGYKAKQTKYNRRYWVKKAAASDAVTTLIFLILLNTNLGE